MKEPYIEGVAIHGGPESCAGVREDDGEALTGVSLGWVLGREMRHTGMPTPLTEAEGHPRPHASASTDVIPRGRRPHARRESFRTEAGRSLRRPHRMVLRAASVRPEAGTR
jgi:hypothetical protein